jgi:molybdenum cofactor biosynthesis enzyme MoaA
VSAEVPGLDAPAILAIFESHQVQYVVVGGYAANLHGSTRVTTDIDVTPNRTHTNLARLAAALRDLGGGIRVDDLEQGHSRSTPRPSRSLGCSP